MEQRLISDISIFLPLGVRSLTFTLFTLTSFQTVFSTENIAYREIFLEMLSK